MCAGLVGPIGENVKISSALVRPKWAHKQQTHISAAYFACPKRAPVRREREPKRQRSDRSEKGLQESLYPTLFDVEQVNCLVQNASYRFFKLCFLHRQGAHFCKNRKKIWLKSEKCTPKTLDGEFGAYMCGLGGAKKRKC